MRLPIVILLACSVCGVAAGADEVRVYTNADLEKFGPPPKVATPVVQDDDRSWERVADFIDREHARLDAERAYELDRLSLDLEQRAQDRRRCDSYRGSYVGYPLYHRYGPTRARHRGTTVGTPSSRSSAIRPLHAGPTQAQRHRDRAIRHSGSDAFPGRSRSR